MSPSKNNSDDEEAQAGQKKPKICLRPQAGQPSGAGLILARQAGQSAGPGRRQDKQFSGRIKFSAAFKNLVIFLIINLSKNRLERRFFFIILLF